VEPSTSPTDGEAGLRSSRWPRIANSSTEPRAMTDALEYPITPGAMSANDIRQLVGKVDPVIVEVGANCGQTTIEPLKAMPTVTIFAFEPEPRAIAKFRNAIETQMLVERHARFLLDQRMSRPALPRPGTSPYTWPNRVIPFPIRAPIYRFRFGSPSATSISRALRR
jgi:hypothetical protein